MSVKTGKLVFVYICFESGYNEWENVEDLIEPGGKHYFLNRTESDELASIFEIQSFPNYILIDKNGIIVDEGSHLRPRETRQEILKLEKEL